MKAVLAATSTLALAFLVFAAPAEAAPNAWAGQVVENDQYVEASPYYLVRSSCTSTAGVGILIHAEGAWRFYTENDCLGYDVKFTDEQCDTDTEGVLSCYYADFVGSQHWLTFEPDGDFAPSTSPTASSPVTTTSSKET